MIHYTYLPYSFTLQSSAILTSLGGDPNSARTLTYIPGISLRGAIAAKLGDPDRNHSVKQEFFDLIFGGKVRYLNAYPVVNGVRALPTPVSMRLEKNAPMDSQTAKAQDLAAFDGNNSPDENPSTGWPEAQLVPIIQGYVGIGASDPTLIEPKMNSRIHQQRDRQKGFSWKKQGAIFTFESLDAHQAFEGAIQLRAETEEELQQIESRIRGLLHEKTLLFGRSRRAAYGGMACLTFGPALRDREVTGSGRQGLQPWSGTIFPDNDFRILLTSPCIIRNTVTGQVDPAALGCAFVELFHKKASLVKTRWAFEFVGGFNRKWRLELPQTLAVSAGSVLVFKANHAFSFADLLMLEHEGVGERKGEGFGRFVFLDKPLPRMDLKLYSATFNGTSGNGERPKLVRVIEARMVKASFDKKIEEKAMQEVRNAINPPRNSLIGRLRSQLRGTDYLRAVETLSVWLGSSENGGLKRPAMDQLEKCQLQGGETLYSWLLKAMDPDTIWNWLDGDSLLRRCSLGADGLEKSCITENPNALSVNLIDAVLAAMAVQNKTSGR
ncbi:MAG: hypothetical protein HGA41_00395 [Syntrophaceae bacterium]|nr:hypothetical protein [Syntrophaceae bacterium]